ncbi:MAG: hypothetical protein BGO91_11305 [Leifsonia sp. 71-9]|nr:MAG: hypothetical protein BGO91_11305 [Leifsonia sp. 71-9]
MLTIIDCSMPGGDASVRTPPAPQDAVDRAQAALAPSTLYADTIPGRTVESAAASSLSCITPTTRSCAP